MYNSQKLLLALAMTLLCLYLSSCQTHEIHRSEWSSQPDTVSGERHVWKVRSCRQCRSVQQIEALSPPILSSVDFDRIVGKEWKLKYEGRNYHTCQHDWKKGVSRAVPTKISNGQVVLVRKGEIYGGFMLITRGGTPETAQFHWRYGTDANDGFDMSDASVTWSDVAKDVQNRGGELMIEFGPFELEWSRNSKDKGWIYYPKSPGDELKENDLAICVTNEQSFDKVRPRDPKWQYRRSPVDGL